MAPKGTRLGKGGSRGNLAYAKAQAANLKTKQTTTSPTTRKQPPRSPAQKSPVPKSARKPNGRQSPRNESTPVPVPPSSPTKRVLKEKGPPETIADDSGEKPPPPPPPPDNTATTTTTTDAPSTISDLLTPSHEAHFRAELWWTLPHPNYRHNIGVKHSERRIKMWREFLPFFKADRQQNEAEATRNRTQNYLENGHQLEHDPETQGGLDEPDAMYW